MTTRPVLAAVLCAASALAYAQQGDPKLTEVWQPVPRVVTPGITAAPPSDAIVLFAGGDRRIIGM